MLLLFLANLHSSTRWDVIHIMHMGQDQEAVNSTCLLLSNTLFFTTHQEQAECLSHDEVAWWMTRWFQPLLSPPPMGAAVWENQENIKYHRKVNNWKCYHSSEKSNRYPLRGGQIVEGLVEKHRFLAFEVIWFFKKFSVKQGCPILYLQKRKES